MVFVHPHRSALAVLHVIGPASYRWVPPLLNPLIDYSRQPRLWAHSFSHQSALVVSASALQQCPSLMATLIRATTSFAEKMTICVLLRVKIAVWCWI